MVKYTRPAGEEARRSLIAYLENHQQERPSTLQEMADALGWNTRRVSHHLSVLREQGLARRNPGSRGWELTPREPQP